MQIPGVVEERVTLNFGDGVAELRLNRADKRNALDNAMFTSLAAAGEFLKTLPGLRSVVLCGEGASFCAGLDFGSFQAMAEGGFAQNNSDNTGSVNAGALAEGRITHLAQQVCWVWQEVPVPVIAVLQGHALGGGMQIALGADIRIAHPDTQLSVREVFWGLVPDMTGTLTLSQLVRADVAKELVFTARVLDAREGLALGLVTRLADDPLSVARAMAQEIASRSPDAVRGAKRLLNRAMMAESADQFAAERKEIYQLIGSANQAEAVSAYFQKRAPVFKD
jgi:enoyl-CoA hydratase/carnithine racemase